MKPGHFLIKDQTTPEVLDWGQLRWLSTPPVTGANQLTVIEVELKPGEGHDFHHHPDQEEVIYIIAGKVEQWVDQEPRQLKSGDSCFIPAGMVHASFSSADMPAKLLAILGPCVGEGGYELVDMADQAPWKDLRKPT